MCIIFVCTYSVTMQAEREELGKAEARSKMEKFLANGMFMYLSFKGIVWIYVRVKKLSLLVG